MKILFITTAHNSLSQRAAIELHALGHDVSVELALSDALMEDAVARYEPDLIVAPFLKKAIPESIWRKHVCLIVHPGIRGDRGPSSLDWAIHDGSATWGVTVLQAIDEMDAGDIWSANTFSTSRRPFAKSALYRSEVTEAAVRGLLEAVDRFASGTYVPEKLDYRKTDVRGTLRPIMKQQDRVIDWKTDSTAAIARKIRAADSHPGVADRLFDEEYLVFGAHEEDRLLGTPGELLAQRDGAICRATVDGAIWLTHLKRRIPDELTLKLPAVTALGQKAATLPVLPAPIDTDLSHRSFREIRYIEAEGVGYLHFDFYNGAMSTDQCRRLRDAYNFARRRPTKVIALLGGRDFWSNGIHLCTIEASTAPADESWNNINAIDDLIREILSTSSHMVVAGIRGNAGAGGVMLALAADRICARRSVVLNPHYKSMGLFGSEYWTYTLPRRVGETLATQLTEACLPIGAHAARSIGLVDHVFDANLAAFDSRFRRLVEELAVDPELPDMLARKRDRRRSDEERKPLARYREEELVRMWHDFYAPDSTYHDARRRFVYKLPPTQTCSRIARHRAGSAGTAIVFDGGARR